MSRLTFSNFDKDTVQVLFHETQHHHRPAPGAF